MKPLRLILFMLASIISLNCAYARNAVQLTYDGTSKISGTARYELVDRRIPALRLRSDLVIVRAKLDGKPINMTGVANPDSPGERLWRLKRSARGRLLELSFAGDTRPSNNHFFDRDIAFTSAGSTPWYPMIGDARMAMTLRIDAPAHLQVRASGSLLSVSRSNDMQTATFVLGYPAYPAFVIAPLSEIARTSADGVSLALDTLRPRRGAQAALDRISQAIAAQTGAFGPFPFSSLRLVEIPTEAGARAGMIAGSFEGFVLIRSDFLDLRGFDFPVIAHEVAHQWWGTATHFSGGDGDYLFDEALAQYGAFLAVDAVLGAAQGACLRSGNDPRGFGGAKQAAAAAVSASPMRLRDLPHSPAAYQIGQAQGGMAWSSLGYQVGTETLHAALTDLGRNHRLRNISLSQVEAAFRRRSPALAAQFAELIDLRDIPRFGGNWQQTGEMLNISLSVSGTPVFNRIPVRIDFADGTSLDRHVSLPGPVSLERVRVNGKVVQVLLDPDHRNLWVSEPQWAEVTALVPIARINRMWNFGDTAGARAAVVQLIDDLPQPDPAGIEFRARLILAEMLEEEGKFVDAVAEYQRALAAVVRPAAELPGAYLRLGRAARAAGMQPIAAEAQDMEWRARDLLRDAPCAAGLALSEGRT